jgi:hypothetical protein
MGNVGSVVINNMVIRRCHVRELSMPKFTDSRYPALLHIINNGLWCIPFQRRRCLQAFLRWSEMKEEKARIALMPHFGPRLVIRTNMSGYGLYTGLDFIAINIRFAEQFEGAMRVDKLRYRARILMESKLLHEMVHWGYTETFLQLEPELFGDRGWKFEVDAYGWEVTSSSLGLEDVIYGIGM